MIESEAQNFFFLKHDAYPGYLSFLNFNSDKNTKPIHFTFCSGYSSSKLHVAIKECRLGPTGPIFSLVTEAGNASHYVSFFSNPIGC